MAIWDVKEPITEPEKAIGMKVKKGSGKPFKSRLTENTVSGIMTHPLLLIPCFTFLEDDSYVEVRRCEIVKTSV